MRFSVVIRDSSQAVEHVTAVVLAAGMSRRFGAHKLLAQLNGAPLVAHAVAGARMSRVDEVVVVVGHEAEAVERSLQGLGVRFVHNRDFRDGMSTSLRAGIRAVPSHGTAALVVLGDQPGVSPRVIDHILDAYRRERALIVRPEYQGVSSHPVLLARPLFPELERITGDRGARGLMERRPADVLTVPVPAPVPLDVDTLEDYRALSEPRVYADGCWGG